MHRRGFSLLELSITLAISGLMLGFILNASQHGPSVNNSECAVSTQLQMNYIRAQIETFARKNDRLPLPAARNVGIDAPTYGRESSGANIDQIGAGLTGVSFGALPFQALGLPTSYAGDCWGNKFTYAVTTALTTNASSGGFLDATVPGNITLKRTAATTAGIDVAYAIISHGPDGLGAVKLNYSAANGVNTPPYTGHGWCSGVTLKHLNCNATAAVVADSTYNDGKDSAANYYDDLVITSGRPKILVEGTPSAYCWGVNTYGQVGDGSTTQRAYATPVTPPNATARFVAITNGLNTTCALTSTGLPYCWGYGLLGQIGNGANANASTPQAVTLPGGVTSFTSLSAGADHVCGIGNNTRVYCWGPNSNGQFSVAGFGVYNTPEEMSRPGGVSGFTKISAGYGANCVIANTGNAYCAGYNLYGQLGNGTNTTFITGLTLVTLPGDPGVTSFIDIAPGTDHMCAIVNTGDAYCAGESSYGQLGSASGATSVLVKVTMPVGVKFRQITTSYMASCALGDDGNAYCWGMNSGQVGDGFWAQRNAPTLVIKPPGVNSFISLGGQTNRHATCGVGDDYKTYCWGQNNTNQLGDGTTTHRNVPTEVTLSTSSLYLGARTSGSCAVTPLPPASWGTNSSYQVGDNTNTKRNGRPVYANHPLAPDSFFTKVTGGATYNRCGIAKSGAAYCWGGGGGNLGNGTNSSSATPKKVSFPASVTAWKDIKATGAGRICAIASGGAHDNKPYCWGSELSLNTPTLVATTCPGNAVASLDLSAYRGGFLCTNGTTWYGWYGIGITAPANTTLIRGVTVGYFQQCILADNSVDGAGQIYCKTNSNGMSALGDGSAQGTQSGFVRVTMPGTATRFTSLGFADDEMGDAGINCALADDKWIYCWGRTLAHLGSNNTGPKLVPTAIVAPAGVTGFTSLRSGSGSGYFRAESTTGDTYYWGCYHFDMDWPAGWSSYAYVATKMPLPLGAQGFLGVGDGRIELVR